MDLEGLGHRIQYRFSNLELLRCALTHRSYGSPHNERLEFLGDSVLNCVVTQVLFDRFPGLDEGNLTRLRASIVKEPSLAAAARRVSLGDELRLGEGELKGGGANRPSMLADAMEAVVGAAFLDGGFDSARRVVWALLGDVLSTIDPATTGKDPKTLLQEFLQARRLALPQYAVVATKGEAHAQQFEVECVIAELGIRSTGEGVSRRSAEQEAARQAYELANRP